MFLICIWGNLFSPIPFILTFPLSYEGFTERSWLKNEGLSRARRFFFLFFFLFFLSLLPSRFSSYYFFHFNLCRPCSFTLKIFFSTFIGFLFTSFSFPKNWILPLLEFLCCQDFISSTTFIVVTFLGILLFFSSLDLLGLWPRFVGIESITTGFSFLEVITYDVVLSEFSSSYDMGESKYQSNVLPDVIGSFRSCDDCYMIMSV